MSKKPTFTGLFTHFDSFTPNIYKSGVVKILLHRAYKICDCFSYMNEEFKRITGFLLENGFSKAFIDKCIRSFLCSACRDKPQIATVEREQIVF